MNKKASFLKHFSIGFIAFMCTLLLVCLTIIVIIQKSLFSPVFLTKAAEKSNYYPNLSTQVSRQIQDFGQGSGIPEEVLKGVITKDQVKKDFEAYTHQSFFGNDFDIEKDDFSKIIQEPIDEYAKKQNQEISPESETAISHFVDTSYDAYSKFIKLPFLPAFGQKIQIFSSKISLFKVILASSLGLMIIFLVYLLHWWLHRLFRYVSHILSGSGLILIVLPLVAKFSGVMSKVAIGSKPLYDLLTTYISSFINYFIIVGVVFLVFSIISAAISEIIRKRF